MNKKERLMAVLNHRMPDHMPVSFWHHFIGDEGEKSIQAHLDYYRETDIDFLKIMCDYLWYDLRYTITKAGDWFKQTLIYSAASQAAPFPPSASCKNLDLHPVNLRFLQLRLTRNSLACEPPHLISVSLMCSPCRRIILFLQKLSNAARPSMRL